MKTKTLMILALCLLAIPIAYSITLDDLVNSYDFNYDSDVVNVTGFHIYGWDTGGDPAKDTVYIEIDFYCESGSYQVIGDLYREGEFIVSDEQRINLSAGHNWVDLGYSSKDLVNGTYNLSLIISKDFLREYVNMSAYLLDYNDSDYEKPGISVDYTGSGLVNTDADPEYEELDLNFSVESGTAETVEIGVYLAGNNRTIVSRANYSLVQGYNDITAKFNSTELRLDRIIDPRLYLVQVKDSVEYRISLDQNISYDFYQLESGISTFTGEFNDSGIGDQPFESLNLSIGLDIVDDGDYTIEAGLFDEYGTMLTAVDESYSLVKGRQYASIMINGTDIYSSKLNGPYVLRYVRLLQDNNVIDRLSYAYTTKNYTYDQFMRNPMPDLMIESIARNSTSTTVIIRNKGESYAVGVSLDMFNSTFGKLAEKLVDMLAPGETRAVIINQTLQQAYAIVDYTDEIEESNESNNVMGYDSYDITLNSGWNLVSLPYQPVNDSVMYVFGAGTSVFTQESSAWYEHDNLFSTIWHVYPGIGYWVRPDSAKTLHIEKNGSERVNATLKAGYNLIGWPSTELINETSMNISTVYSYENGSWKTWVKDRKNNTLDRFEQGKGYWVRVS